MAKQAKHKQRTIEWLIQVKNRNGYGETMGAVVSRLESYLTEYEHIFRSKTKRFFDRVQTYCRGIFMSELSNIERISEEMFADYHQMFERHCRRQRDINVAFEKQILMC